MTDFAGGVDHAWALSQDLYGRILVAGSAHQHHDYGNNLDIALARYLVTSSDLSLTMTGDPPTVGLVTGGVAPITYTITVKNNGPDPAPRVDLTLTFSSAVDFSSVYMPPFFCNRPIPPVNPSGCVYELGSMNSGEEQIATIMVVPTVAGELIGTAMAIGSDPAIGNNTASVTTTVTSPTVPEGPPVPPPPGGEAVPPGSGTTTPGGGTTPPTEIEKPAPKAGGGCSLKGF
jgi:hypothetical protein